MFNTFVSFSPLVIPTASHGLDQDPVLIPYASAHPIFNVESLRTFLDHMLFNRVTSQECDFQGAEFDVLKEEYYSLDEIDLENFYNDLIAVWQCSVLRTKPLGENEAFPVVDLAGTHCGKLIGARLIDISTFELFPYLEDVVEGSGLETEELFVRTPGDSFGLEITINPGILGVASIEEVETGGHQIRLLDNSFITLSDEEATGLIPFITNVKSELSNPKSNFNVFFNATALAQVVAFCVLADQLDLLVRYLELHSAYEETIYALEQAVLALGKPKA